MTFQSGLKYNLGNNKCIYFNHITLSNNLIDVLGELHSTLCFTHRSSKNFLDAKTETNLDKYVYHISSI